MCAYKRIFEDESKSLKEMANLPIKLTGLSRGTIYLSNRESSHGARIKYYRGRAGEDKPSASISISKNPEVKVDSINLTSKEEKEIFKFVIKNYKHLMKIWNMGETMSIIEWLDEIKPI